MRISDWSSDVCSSDLRGIRVAVEQIDHRQPGAGLGAGIATQAIGDLMLDQFRRTVQQIDRHQPVGQLADDLVALGTRRRQFAVVVIKRQRRQRRQRLRSEEHTSELQSLMRISYAVFCLKKQITESTNTNRNIILTT